MVRGVAVGILLALVAVGCSSSSNGATPTTTPATGTPETLVDGTRITNPDGTDKTTPAISTTTTVPSLPTTPPTDPQVTVPPTTTTTVPPPPPPPLVTRWKLAVDYRSHPGTNPFASYLGGWPNWSLRQSDSLRRTGNYPMLPTFSSRFATDGVSGWHANSGGCDSPPSAGSLTIDAPLQVCTATVPAKAAFVYPGSSQMAVVGWVSTFDGTAEVTAGVADVDPGCGDGVSFWIDRGTTNLAAITLVNADARQLQSITTHVKTGESIYFIVGPGVNGNNDCDTTQLALTIDRVL